MNTATKRTEPAAKPTRRPAAAAAAAGFIAIAGFEAALALGAPLGNAAWGGANAHLAPGLRIASGITVAIWVFAALVVLGRTGYRVSKIPFRVCLYGTWVLFGYLSLGTLMNLASRSNWDQGDGGLQEAFLCLLVARAATPPPRDSHQVTRDH